MGKICLAFTAAAIILWLLSAYELTRLVRATWNFEQLSCRSMDVATRQHMWQVILSSLRHSCVVLTTHSMEEADALSTRIAIMVNGKIRCIGSSQELKAKYGQGYQLELQLRSTATVETVVRFIKERWFGELTESFGSRLLFALAPATPREPIIASRLFAEVETNREKWGLVEYAVSQPSLEQIFLKFAQGQRLEEE